MTPRNLRLILTAMATRQSCLLRFVIAQTWTGLVLLPLLLNTAHPSLRSSSLSFLFTANLLDKIHDTGFPSTPFARSPLHQHFSCHISTLACLYRSGLSLLVVSAGAAYQSVNDDFASLSRLGVSASDAYGQEVNASTNRELSISSWASALPCD